MTPTFGRIKDDCPAHAIRLLVRAASQEAFPDELGVHRPYMGAIEREERNLTLRSLERIADCLGMDPMELMKRRMR